MIRYNRLKIYVLATEAKPGGNIGAMLSPYLFSTNMGDFCKKFNEITKDYLNTVWLPVFLYTDIVEKQYSFFIKPISISMFILDYYEVNRKISIGFLYDLVLYCSKTLSMNVYKMSLVILSILKGFLKRYWKIRIFDELEVKVINVL